MIFYTVKGPKYHLEIHDDQMKLKRQGWLNFFLKKEHDQRWDLNNLSHFQITIPQYLFWGKLEWESFDGKKGCFRFSTNSVMVTKIEKYLQKRIIKNFERSQGPTATQIFQLAA